MKIRKITALCTSLLMCAAVFAGCGSENEESSEKKTKTTINSSVQKTTDDQKTTKDKEKTDEEETTTESEEDSELYEYYDLLNEEFEKGNISNKNFTANGFFISTYELNKYKNKIIFMNHPPYEITSVAVFDTETKESKTFDMGTGDFRFQNGFFYSVTNDGKLVKYDTDGNVVSSLAVDSRSPINIVSPEGKVIIDSLNYDDYSNHYYLIQTDFSEEKEIPQPKRDVGHNMTEDVKQYDWICFDGDKAYATAYISNNEYGIFCLDTNTLTWTQLNSLSEKWDYRYDSNFGKYIVQNQGHEDEKLINIETGEEIANLTYFRTGENTLIKGIYSCAGLSHHILKKDDERWYDVRHPGNGEIADTDKCEPLGKESLANDADAYAIDDTYYAIIDDTGVFLRTYEKGEAEEETIYLFEKN